MMFRSAIALAVVATASSKNVENGRVGRSGYMPMYPAPQGPAPYQTYGFGCYPYVEGMGAAPLDDELIANYTINDFGSTFSLFTNVVDIASTRWCPLFTIYSKLEQVIGAPPGFVMPLGIPRKGSATTVCGGQKKNNNHQAALWDSQSVGAFGTEDSVSETDFVGGPIGVGVEKDCFAWCLYDLRQDNRVFVWNPDGQCYKYKSGNCAPHATAEEKQYAQSIRENVCLDSAAVDEVVANITQNGDNGFSCIAGSTEVEVSTDSTVTSAIKSAVGVAPSTRRVEVKNLVVGDMIQGFDEKKQPTWCEVKAVGLFGTGWMSGNYTANHYIYNTDSDSIRAHGTAGNVTYEDKYDVLTSCPLGVDVAGNGFSAIDGDFCGVDTTEVAWSDWLALHTAILNVVQQSGSYWFSQAAYTQKGDVKSHTAKICAEMLKCSTTSDCDELEKLAEDFIENVLTKDAAKETRVAFPELGHPEKPGSVAYTVKGSSAPFHTTTAGIITIAVSSAVALIILVVAVVLRRRRVTNSVSITDKVQSVVVEVESIPQTTV